MEESLKKAIFVVIPAYNEEKRIVNTLNDLLKYDYKIVVVNDCSSDNTYVKVKDFIKENNLENKITLLKHKINRGQGAALQTGTDFAVGNGADIIVHFDADGQHRNQDIFELIKPILEVKVDFVFGSRFLGKKSNIPWFKEKIILPVSKIINLIFSGLNLSDTHNGLRAFNAKIVNKLYLTQDGMAHNTEYPYLVKKNKIKYTEVPITIIYHEFGQGITGGFKILKELFIGKLIK